MNDQAQAGPPWPVWFVAVAVYCYNPQYCAAVSMVLAIGLHAFILLQQLWTQHHFNRIWFIIMFQYIYNPILLGQIWSRCIYNKIQKEINVKGWTDLQGLAWYLQSSEKRFFCPSWHLVSQHLSNKIPFINIKSRQNFPAWLKTCPF